MSVPFAWAGKIPVLTALVFAFCGASAQELPFTPSQLATLGVQVKPLGAPVDIAGHAYPAQIVTPPTHDRVVSAPQPGLIERILVTENQAVRPGDALARLASPEIGDLQLRFMEASAQDRLARTSLQREQSLFKEGIVPERRVQEAQAAATQSDARLRQALAALRLAGVDEATARRAAQGGAIESAVVIRAPSAGVVTQLTARPGQRVSQADALLHITDVSRLWLDIQVPGARRADVATAIGTRVQVQVQVEAGAGAQGIEARIVSAGVTVGANQTFVLRAEITQGGAGLRPGEYLQVRVPFAAGAEGWAVPVQAVVHDKDQAFVFVRSARGFVPTRVRVMATSGEVARITGSTLQARQEIALTAVSALKSVWQTSAQPGN